jgi:hypothetical protein
MNSRTRVVWLLKGTGKYLVFLLLNGLGGIIVATITTFVIVHNFDWILGQPKAGTAYGAVVEVVSWGFWGLMGALVAVFGYSRIFKQYPPRWMGITTVSVCMFGWMLTILAIVGGSLMGEEIDLDTWKDFVHVTAAIVTFWYLFSLPPLSRAEYDTNVAVTARRSITKRRPM